MIIINLIYYKVIYYNMYIYNYYIIVIVCFNKNFNYLNLIDNHINIVIFILTNSRQFYY